MRFYNGQHRFYCGVDLHARSMYLCILEQAGQVVFHGNLAASPAAFLAAVAPFRDGLVVSCECLFAWYWLADLCAVEKIPFVLGHALYMKAIHGGKSKNDKLDAEKIARLLRGGNLPMAYVYPKGMRETRDLLRRRSFLVGQRAGAIAHIQFGPARSSNTELMERRANVASDIEHRRLNYFMRIFIAGRRPPAFVDNRKPDATTPCFMNLVLTQTPPFVVADLQKLLIRRGPSPNFSPGFGSSGNPQCLGSRPLLAS